MVLHAVLPVDDCEASRLRPHSGMGDQPVLVDDLALVLALAGCNNFFLQACERVVDAANAVAGVILFVHRLTMQARCG